MNKFQKSLQPRKLFLRNFKRSGRLFLSLFGMIPVKKHSYEDLLERAHIAETVLKWIAPGRDSKFEAFMRAGVAGYPLHSQLQQDLIAIYIQSLHSDGPGFFVEFGASNGITYSNTYLLEKQFGWNGILAEPAHVWHKHLTQNRSCVIDTRCVWSHSGQFLTFNQVEEAEYSTIVEYSDSDNHAEDRRYGSQYIVETISLADLLGRNSAPKIISYLSVDTEGSEYEILANFNFDEYLFNFISVEHNFSENRETLKQLLEANGYRRVFSAYSEWDDWYIRVCDEVENFLREIK